MTDLEKKSKESKDIFVRSNVLENLSDLMMNIAYLSMVPGSLIRYNSKKIKEKEETGESISCAKKSLSYIGMGTVELFRLGMYGIVMYDTLTRGF